MTGMREPVAEHAGDEAGFRQIGRRMRRADAGERLTGQTRFAADLRLPDALHARFVVSPHASARIVSINRDAALALPGVAAVLTARDLPLRDVERSVDERRIPLALDRVVHAGQPVAVVLGETEAAAEDGAEAVTVEYETLEAVVDMEEAGTPGAPVVRGRLHRDEAALGAHGTAGGAGSAEDVARSPNVAGRAVFQRGDTAAGFREAHAIVEYEFHTSWVHQGYLEPQSCAAVVDPLGNLVVYASTQAMFSTRHEVASLLGLPEHNVTVRAMPVGGAFGGKFALIEPLVAALALATGRAVRLSYTRMEEFGTACPAPASRFRIRAGARANGRLVALEASVLFDSGANPGSPFGIAAELLASTYRWENLHVEGAEVLTNRASTGAYRGPGAPQAAFAIESAVDELARRLAIDPVELRLRNVVEEGDVKAGGDPWPVIGLRECLERARAIYDREQAARGPSEGVGIAVGAWPGGLEPASALCRLDADGSLQVMVGSVDLTGSATGFQIIAAEAFGLMEAERVRVTTADTSSAPQAGATGGSKITYTVGLAVERAARDAREQVLQIASAELEAAPEDLEIADGRVEVRGLPGRGKTLKEIYQLSTSFGAHHAPVLGRGQSATYQSSPGFAVHVLRVRVDEETGDVRPLRCVVIQDVGRAINPAGVEGQMHGGAIQGIGWGLFERIAFDEQGAVLSTSFMDYALPTASHCPEVLTEIVEVPTPLGPFGARGVGEPPVIPGAAAVANAVRDAVGVRITDLPLTSERVRRALAC